MIEFDNIISGALGVVLGTLLGAWLTYRFALQLDESRRKRERTDLKSKLLSSLRSEIDLNTELAGKVQINHAKIRFISRALDLAIQHAELLPETVLGKIRSLHAEIARFNDLVDYDREKVDYGLGYLDQPIGEQANLVRFKLSEAKQELEKK